MRGKASGNSNGKAQRWFDRCYDPDADSDKWVAFSPYFKGPREMWRKATRYNALFLTTACHLRCEQLAPLMQWFKSRLRVSLTDITFDYRPLAEQAGDRSSIRRVVARMQAVGINVDDVRTVQLMPLSPNQTAPYDANRYVSPQISPEIEFRYNKLGVGSVWMDRHFEAAGVTRLFRLFALLDTAASKEQLLIIDDFDIGLHPLVARHVIQSLSGHQVTQRGMQVLLTSHNSTLMNLDILRRDEIWLMKIDSNLGSNLSQLQLSSSRKRKAEGERYLQGRYGAIPTLTPLRLGSSELERDQK